MSSPMRGVQLIIIQIDIKKMSQIQIGARVQTNTFRLRGLEAIVMYIGSVQGKEGQWVGLKLSEPKGDMDGTINGEHLFDCEPSFGTLLRPNQVKLIEEENPFSQAQDLNESVMSGNLQKSSVSGGMSAFLQNRLQNLANAEGAASQQTIESGDQANQRSAAWKNKIEELRKKKQEDQKNKANNNTSVLGLDTSIDPALEQQKKEIAQVLAPNPGLQKDKEGNIAVNQQQAQKPLTRFAQMRQQMQAAAAQDPIIPIEEAKNDTQIIPQDAQKAPEKPAMTKPGVIAKPGTTASGTLKPTTQPGAPKTSLTNQVAQAVAVKAKNEFEEKKDKLAQLRKDRETTKTGKIEPPTTAQTTATASKLGASKVGTAATGAKDNTGAAPTRPESALASKLGTGLKKTLAPSASNAQIGLGNNQPPKESVGNLSARPSTARTSAVEKKDSEPGSATKRTTMSKLGQSLAQKLNKPVGAGAAKPQVDEMKQSILEQVNEEEQQTSTRTLQNNRLTQSRPKPAESVIEYRPPTDEQLMQFMLQSGGVSQEEHKKTQDELRKKKEETFSLQLEVKELSSKISQLQSENSKIQSENNQAIELLKTEYEIKMLELEQKLGGSNDAIANAAESTASAVAQQIELLTKNYTEKIENLKKSHNEQMEATKLAHSEQIQAMQQQIKEMQEEGSKSTESQIKNLQDSMKAQQAQAQEQIEKAYDQIKQLQSVVDFMKMEKTELTTQISQMQKDINEAEKEKGRLNEEIQGKQADIEIVQLEVEALKDEKEELLNQMKMAAEMNANQEDALAGLTEDELKSQNQKLRQAISSLSMNFEVEKSRLVTKLAEASERAKQADEFEQKLEEMDLLLEEIDLKEREKADMEAKLDEALEFEKMVEEMAEEIMNKEDEIETLHSKIKELEENIAIQEELNENQDDYITELNEDIANKDAQISNFENEKAQLEEMILEADQQHQRYKDKINEMTQQLQLLQFELQSAYATGDQKVKISSLVERQNVLVQKLREAGKKDTQMIIAKIHFWQEKLRMKVIEGFIPSRIQNETHLESLEKVQQLNITRNKALLLVREICEKQLSNIPALHEDAEQQNSLVNLLIQIADSSIELMDICARIVYSLSKMSIEKYKDATTKLMSWSKLTFAAQFIEKILDLLKDGALSSKFDISTFIQSVKSLLELQKQVESKYVEKNEGEEGSEKARERDADVKECQRTRLRNELTKMLLGVTALSIHNLNADANEEQISKSRLIYWRLLDILYKIDYIEGHQNGGDFLNLTELGIDMRLQNKHHVIKTYMWDKQGDTNINVSEKRDWLSVLEAIERDITSLGNDYKFKKLVAKIADETKDSQVHVDDIYTLGWDVRGPWNEIVKNIRQDFEDTESMKEKIEHQADKLKEQAKQHLLLKREKEELVAVNVSLETRLSDALMKAEQVATLEIDKKRLLEKEKGHLDQIESVRKELENQREKEKALQKKIEDLENNPVVLPQQSTKASYMKKIPVVQTPSNAAAQNSQNRQTSRQEYFKRLSMSSLNKRESTTNRQSTVNASSIAQALGNTDLNRQLQQTEETLQGVIMELQKDRMSLKSQNMMERLMKLERGDGPMSQYIIKQRDRQEGLKRYSREEQKKLESAVETVDCLKSKVKKEMALIKVIDLSKKEAQNPLQEQQKGDQNEQISEKINYMLIKAKDQVNDALDVLFAKDSSLNKLRSLREAIITNTLVQPSSQLGKEKVKVGSLRVNGLVMPKKVVNLSENSLSELKSNLAVFVQ